MNHNIWENAKADYEEALFPELTISNSSMVYIGCILRKGLKMLGYRNFGNRLSMYNLNQTGSCDGQSCGPIDK